MSRWIVLIITLLLPAFANAQINAIPAAPHLLVKGHAESLYVPDRFSVSLWVAETDMMPDKARAKVEQHLQQIFAALESNHAMRDKTAASSLQITPSSEYRDGHNVFLGTQVSRGVNATFDSLDQLRGFLAQLQASEAVQVRNTEVWRSDIDKIRLALRKRAMLNSQETARQIAATYGMSIKGVYSVSEVAPDFAYGIRAGSWGNDDSHGALAPPAPPAPPADITVTANRLPNADLRVGTINVEQDIYAVYLTAPQTP